MLYILSYDRTASCQISNNVVRTAAAVRLEQWGVAREQCQSQAPWRSSKSRISPESKKKIGKARSGKSGKSGWQSWREKRDIRQGLEEQKNRAELAVLRAKVESADPIVPYQAAVGSDDPWPPQGGSELELPLPEALPVEPPTTVSDRGIQAIAQTRDADCQTPNWDHPQAYLYGLEVIAARPHYINGVPPTDVPSPNPRLSKNRQPCRIFVALA